MKITRRQIRRIIREAGYEARYFDRHGTTTPYQYSPDEQFRENLHFILDTSPSKNSYWRQAYKFIEALDDDERYMAEVLAEKMWSNYKNPHDGYRF